MQHLNAHPLLYAVLGCLIGFCVAAFVCFQIVRCWRFAKLGWDKGDLARKPQSTPILRLGGVGVASALVALTAIWGIVVPSMPGRILEPWTLLAVCLLFFGVGILDDMSSVPALLKLAAQIAIASFAYSFGFRVELLSSPFSPASIELGGLSFLVTVVWIVAIPNLINLTDGMDGLAGGISIALVGTLAVVSWMGRDMVSVVLTVGMIGGILGFLLFNLPRARLYLGDGGAYLIGAFIACVSIPSSQKGPIAGSLLVVVIALALPIADASFAVLRRFFYGFPIWQADREHIHHRLVTLGLRRGVVIGLLILAVVFFSVLGLLLLYNPQRLWPVSITMGCGVAIFLMRKLGYWGSWSAFRNHVKRIWQTRRRVRYACALGTVLEHELDWVDSAEEFWKDFHRALMKSGMEPNVVGMPEREGKQCLDVPLADGRVWRLWHPSGCEEMHWGKVAGCFLGPLSRAISKWGDAAPDLGLVSAPPSPVASGLSVQDAPKATGGPLTL